MSYILGIFDPDTDYANQLMDYIKRKQKAITQVRIFTNAKSLIEYLEHDKLNVLLLNEEINTDEVLHRNIKNICILSEGNFAREEENCHVIYKFQSAQKVMEELFSYFPLEDTLIRAFLSGNGSLNIISVFSVGKENERQVFSYFLASEYAKIKRTLYINLDLFSPWTKNSGSNFEKGLSEFIYYLKQSHPNLISKMNGIVTKINNLDCIQGVSFGPDIYELVPEDIYYWIKTLKESSEYEVIIFDVGCFFESTLELFRSSNELLLLIGDQRLEEEKYRNFRSQLQLAGYGDVLVQITEVAISKDVENRLGYYTPNDLYSEEYRDIVMEYVKSFQEV
nr:hypothetical protein [uncultured Anaerocolumna sp.]